MEDKQKGGEVPWSCNRSHRCVIKHSALEPKRRDRAHATSAVTLAPSLSAMPQEHWRHACDQAHSSWFGSTREILSFYYLYIFFSCNPTLGGAVKSKTSTWAFQAFSFVSFLFLYDFNGFVYVFCYHERLKPSTKIEDEASSLISSIFLMILFIQFRL